MILLIAISFDIPAQNSWNVEVNGGPSVSYSQTTFLPATDQYRELNRLSFNAGVNVLYRLSSTWELQSEISRANRATGITIVYNGVPNVSYSRGEYTKYNTFSSPYLGIGTRYTSQNSKVKYYINPSIGIIVNRDKYAIGHTHLGSPPFQSTISYRHLQAIGLYAKIETGIRIFTQNSNYFLIGVRHVHGFNKLESVYSENFYLDNQPLKFSTTNKGSYTSLILGYGLNLENISFRKKSNLKKEDSAKDIIMKEAALSDGEYVVFYGGFRRKEPHQSNPLNIYSNYNGLFTLAYGFRINHFSIEGGISKIFDNNNFNIDYETTKAVFTNSEPYSIWAIPVTLKYDLDLGKQKRLRAGVLFSGNGIIKNSSGEGSGTINHLYTDENTIVEVKGNYKSVKVENKNKLFYNSGIYFEALAFRSTFISINLARYFGSPVLNSYEVDYQVNGVPYQRTINSSINGWTLTFGLKKPINTLKVKKRFIEN